MNPLQINDVQKARLAVMCLKLFPETPYLYWGKNWDRDRLSIGNYKEGEIWDDKKPQKIYYFHWFEFCLLHVTHALGYMPDWLLRGEGGYDVLKENHPIDYLYDEFKKLNT